MGKLRRRKDGGYFTVGTALGKIYTLQIHPEGAEFLFQNDVRPGMEIPKSIREILWEEDWFYTKSDQAASDIAGFEAQWQGPDDLDELDVRIAEDVYRTSGNLDELTNALRSIENFGVVPHVQRPLFLYDSSIGVHYTVLHLQGRSRTDPVVVCIKFRAADWLKSQGVRIGDTLPEGMFAQLFMMRGIYPNPGWEPSGAKPLKIR